MSSVFIPKNYYQDWRSVGWQLTVRNPDTTTSPGKLLFDMPYPFFFIALANLGALPSSGLNYPNSFITMAAGSVQFTYTQMLQSMYIAMAFANRDFDAANASTQPTIYTSVENQFAGYFKQYLNPQQLSKYYNTFLMPVARMLNAADVLQANTATVFFNTMMNANVFPQLTNLIDKKLLGCPGNYSLKIDTAPTYTSPYGQLLAAYNGAIGVANMHIWTMELKPIE